jgi:hypothetical protein
MREEINKLMARGGFSLFSDLLKRKVCQLERRNQRGEVVRYKSQGVLDDSKMIKRTLIVMNLMLQR